MIRTIINWAKSDIIVDQNLIREMFSLLHRQYDGVSEASSMHFLVSNLLCDISSFNLWLEILPVMMIDVLWEPYQDISLVQIQRVMVQIQRVMVQIQRVMAQVVAAYASL